MEEPIVRIRALTSRNRTLFKAAGDSQAQTAIGTKYVFDSRLGILKGERIISLTAREAELLRLLLLNRNQVLERKAILLHIWNNDDFFAGRSLDVFISRLRRYLEPDESVRIINIRGIGYKLVW